MRRKMTPEQQDALIKRMTSQWKKEPYPLPYGKVQPSFCEHCDHAMSKTGRLPARSDHGSWAHWIGCKVGEHGVQKVHSLSMASDHGQCCVACFKAFQEWGKEYDDEEAKEAKGGKQ